MIKNKFSIYVIENSLELLTKINENYYINSMKNNLGNSFNNNNEDEKIDSDDEDNNADQDSEFSYQNFCKLKKKFSNLSKIIQQTKKRKKF